MQKKMAKAVKPPPAEVPQRGRPKTNTAAAPKPTRRPKNPSLTDGVYVIYSDKEKLFLGKRGAYTKDYREARFFEGLSGRFEAFKLLDRLDDGYAVSFLSEFAATSYTFLENGTYEMSMVPRGLETPMGIAKYDTRRGLSEEIQKSIKELAEITRTYEARKKIIRKNISVQEAKLSRFDRNVVKLLQATP